MDLIVTHNNADFDALGSLIAAKKLYPRSRLLLPGSPEKAVRDFLMLFKDVIGVESENECNLEGISRLIVVDTRHKSRIGIASRLIDERGIRPVIYDHHPRTEHDMLSAKDVYRQLGATVTILLDILRKRRVRFTPIEATILLLAIYEETGSLTFRTTTRTDVDAVSYLLSHGAKLNMVSSYLNSELTEEQLAFLVRLISSTHIHNINGIKVAICQCREDEYVGELGTVVHKLVEIENVKVVFVLLQVNSKINVIARSHIQDVDVNRILKHFGGAGHAAAASGKVFGADLEGLKTDLIQLLKKYIKIRICAEDIMSRPIIIDVNTKIRDAKKFLLKNRLDAAVVLSEKRRPLGVITTRNINKAVRRGFSHARVKGYMYTKINTLKPSTPFYKIQDFLCAKDIGLLPVIKGRRLVGIVTRNDVLKTLHQGLVVDDRIAKKGRPVLNLAKKMQSDLPVKITRLLKFIGNLAYKRQYAAFVVGGFVRDLVMSVKNLDIDIVVEGNAVEFSRDFADRSGGTLVVHKKFGTATVVMPWGLAKDKRFKVDIATARREKYKHPAALPDVEFSSLRDDLSRRDFTINAMAIALSGKNFGQLIDFFDGQRHLREGIISVLHEGSFIDDPTRIFRAVRFEQRYGFRIDETTEKLIKTAIKKDMFGRTEKQRIRDELVLMLNEEDPIRAITRMHQLDELRFIHPRLELNRQTRNLFVSIEKTCSWYKTSPLKTRPLDIWLIYLIALFENLDYKKTKGLCDKFVFRRGDKLRILSYKKQSSRIIKSLSGKKDTAPSKAYKMLHGLAYEVILLILAKAKENRAKTAVIDFLLRHNTVKTAITGGDLEKIGFKPGPGFGETLKKILYAKLDGKIKTKKDELAYADRLLRRS